MKMQLLFKRNVFIENFKKVIKFRKAFLKASLVSIENTLKSKAVLILIDFQS
jgi:hypothetical protein